MRKLRTALLLSLALAGAAQAKDAARPLKLDVYNPGDKGIFPVASVLVEGERDAVLVDAQFAKGDAQKLVEKIKASGRHLTTIYISHGDPDYYFGLDVLHAAFPDAKIVASKPTVEHIQASSKAKLAYWGPILKQDAPAALVVPDVLEGSRLTLEGRALDVVGLDGPTPERSFVWIPSLKAVVGGVVVFSNLHVWMADTQTPASHAQWLATLDRIEQLKPAKVIPGHYQEGTPFDLSQVRYTRGYIQAYDAEAAKAKDAAALVAAMEKRYPKAGEKASLELSAKVSKGEKQWP
ncbi:MBL fold metallo-hydrolase [Dyella sp. SG609]|uniref:MBL fold metallo-hydrolase n=1 Tax=Dyella sp. SG609 TaxID=2587018 RepID=UPI001445B10B|nr:MBL fold metallo-hydrolase [Dyella sp. SG609]NKJ19536.1 glyoxylase-like metal-dependent hydrolase (beta-lactamase superfamily II) [Dyella sp. SG609]